MIAIVRNNVMTLYDNTEAFYNDVTTAKNNFINISGINMVQNKSNEKVL